MPLNKQNSFVFKATSFKENYLLRQIKITHIYFINPLSKKFN